MLFPTYPRKSLPNVGDVVTYTHCLEPWVVERIVKDGIGNVCLQIRCGDRYIHRERLEVLNWYPKPGDVCQLALKPYLDWRKAYGDYEIPVWMHKKCELISIHGNFARVKLSDGTVQRIPFQCLRVVNDCCNAE